MPTRVPKASSTPATKTCRPGAPVVEHGDRGAVGGYRGHVAFGVVGEVLAAGESGVAVGVVRLRRDIVVGVAITEPRII
jgi:hypothetical protein